MTEKDILQQHRERRREQHRLRKIVESLPHFGDSLKGKSLHSVIKEQDEKRAAYTKKNAKEIEERKAVCEGCSWYQDEEKDGKDVPAGYPCGLAPWLKAGTCGSCKKDSWSKRLTVAIAPDMQCPWVEKGLADWVQDHLYKEGSEKQDCEACKRKREGSKSGNQ